MAREEIMKKEYVFIMALCIASILNGCASKEAQDVEQSNVENVANNSVSVEIENKELVNMADGKEIAPKLDIEGCDTFTQIVDRKLENGMGYSNVRIGDEDVLLVSSGCFDNGDGFMAAIDAEIFRYAKDGSIEEIGHVTSGGTAYPLSLRENKLICGANHWFAKFTIEKGKLVLLDQIWAEYATNDEENAFYKYSGEDDKILEQLKDEDTFWQMTDDYNDGTPIEFSVVSK